MRRVLFPLLMQVGLMRNWAAFEALLKDTGTGFRGWYVKLEEDRFGTISRNPGLARTVLTQLLVNDELRSAMETVWRQHIWSPMVESLRSSGRGAVRKDIDAEVLARAIHCLHVGYFMAPTSFCLNAGGTTQARSTRWLRSCPWGAAARRANPPGRGTAQQLRSAAAVARALDDTTRVCPHSAKCA